MEIVPDSQPRDNGPPIPAGRQIYRRILQAYPEVRQASPYAPAICDAPDPPRSPQTVAVLIGTFAKFPTLAEAFVAALAVPLRRLVRAIIAEELEGRTR